MIQETDVWEQNPWWTNAGNIHKEKEILAWNESKLHYIPRLMHKIQYDFSPANTVVYVLRGPRQVGKTTLVKLQIKDFLSNGVSPWNILYYSLDVSAKQDIVNVINHYSNIASKQWGQDRRYVFLDEVSAVPDWQMGVKWLIDRNKLKNTTILCLGSHSVDLKDASERLPGRRGETDDTYDKILFPMKFSEYAMTVNNEVCDLIQDNNLLRFDNRRDIITKLFNHKIDERIDKMYAYQNVLSKILCEYMLTGGMPKVINSVMTTGFLTKSDFSIYSESIAGEWSHLNKNTNLLKHFGKTIINNLGSHTSWNNLARNADLGSANTAQDYALTLKDLLIISIIHLYDHKKRRPRTSKEKKFYFQDPFFLHVFNDWTASDPDLHTAVRYRQDEGNQGRMVEGIVADHLIRWAFCASPRKQLFQYDNHIFYWKDKTGHEVDFVYDDRGAIQVPIEVKFRNKIMRNDLTGMFNFLRNTETRYGLVLSKNYLQEKQDYVVMPVPIFLLLI